MVSESNRLALGLFQDISRSYDIMAEVPSFYQNRRWRKYVVSRLRPARPALVLDLCTGTGSVGLEMARGWDCSVVGVDLCRQMLAAARQKVRRAGKEERLSLVRGRAEGLPFAEASFDAVCFTYLLRYVESPAATLHEVVRVLKPGGALVSLEFGVPPGVIRRWLWHAYTRMGLPLMCRFVSPGWRRVGAFLGPSISQFYRAHPEERLLEYWRAAGLSGVGFRRLSMGGAIVTWGTKEAGRGG